MAGSVQPFRMAGVVTIAASTAAASVSLAGAGDDLVVTNTSAAVAFVVFDSTATAANGFPVLPGSRVLLGGARLATSVSVILASGTGSVVVARGDGSAI